MLREEILKRVGDRIDFDIEYVTAVQRTGSEKLRFVGGARVERSEQNVDTRDLFDPNAEPIRASLDDTDLLPGLNLIYRLHDTLLQKTTETQWKTLLAMVRVHQLGTRN